MVKYALIILLSLLFVSCNEYEKDYTDLYNTWELVYGWPTVVPHRTEGIKVTMTFDVDKETLIFTNIHKTKDDPILPTEYTYSTYKRKGDLITIQVPEDSEEQTYRIGELSNTSLLLKFPEEDGLVNRRVIS